MKSLPNTRKIKENQRNGLLGVSTEVEKTAGDGEWRWRRRDVRGERKIRVSAYWSLGKVAKTVFI